MAKRLSRAKKKKYLSVAAAITVVAVGVITAFIVGIHQIKSKYELETAALTKWIESNQRLVYRAAEPIPAGSAITEDNVVLTKVPSDMDQSLYMSEDMIGKIAVMDIAEGQDIFKVMVGTADMFSIREVEYAVLALNSNLKKDDFVDVRIMYPNGENYSVVPKACVKGINPEQNEIYFWLDETQIMDMSSAIVDAYMNEGAILYTAKYVEDSQDAVTANYQPSEDVMVAMANDPNIVGEASVALTERMNATLRQSVELRQEKFNTKKEGKTSSGVDLSGVVSSGTVDYNGDTTTDPDIGEVDGSNDLDNNTEDGGFSFGE